MSQDGQVSETSMMSTAGGAEGTPGTDDGVPPADAARQEADGSPDVNVEKNEKRPVKPTDESTH